MVLGYSITDGIGMGVITFVVFDVILYVIDSIRFVRGTTEKRPRTEMTFVTLVVFILFLIYFLVPTVI